MDDTYNSSTTLAQYFTIQYEDAGKHNYWEEDNVM